MNKTLLYGAATVGAFMAYQYFAARIVTADFMGYEIVAKKGYFFAREKATGKTSLDMPDITTVQKWIGAQKAASALKGWLPGIGDDLLLPSEGRTVTASGQVLNGLGMVTSYQDAYDATPSQYRRDAINDFVPGIGDLGRFSFKRSVGNVARAVVKAPSIIAKAPATLLRTAAGTIMVVADAAAKPTLKNIIRLPERLVSTASKGLISVVIPSKPKKEAVPGGGGVSYVDANGNPITEWQYNTLLKASQDAAPKVAVVYKGFTIWTTAKPDGGVSYLVNYNEAANTMEGAYSTMSEAQGAIDSSIPGGSYPPAPAQTNIAVAKRSYDIAQAEREASSITSGKTSDDYGSSTTSDDSGYGKAQTVTEDGSPTIPEKIAFVQAPSAQMLPSPAPSAPETKKGNTAVGVVVGGGILAAIAAAAMS